MKPTVKTAILLNMDPRLKPDECNIGFQTFYKTTLHQDQTICIRTIKESGNTVINKTVDITKTDARKMTFENIFQLINRCYTTSSFG
jgi:hypothetical protein